MRWDDTMRHHAFLFIQVQGDFSLATCPFIFSCRLDLFKLIFFFFLFFFYYFILSSWHYNNIQVHHVGFTIQYEYLSKLHNTSTLLSKEGILHLQLTRSSKLASSGFHAQWSSGLVASRYLNIIEVFFWSSPFDLNHNSHQNSVPHWNHIIYSKMIPDLTINLVTLDHKGFLSSCFISLKLKGGWTP